MVTRVRSLLSSFSVAFSRMRAGRLSLEDRS